MSSGNGICRRDFLKRTGGSALGAAAASMLGGFVHAGTSGRRPNLLVLQTDQQRFDTLAAYGNKKLQMPKLNRLASQSTVFERAYVTQPLCSPSRATMLTGLYPHSSGVVRNNVPLPNEHPTIPEMLGDGYATMHCGKWHLGDELFAQRGFQEWVSTEDGYGRYFSEGRDRATRSSYHGFLTEKGVKPDNPKANTFSRQQACSLPEELGKPSFQAAKATEFIRWNRKNPFALYVSLLEPHSPFCSPRDNQYDPAKVDIPPNFDDTPGPGDHPNARQRLQRVREKGFAKNPLRTKAEWRKLIAKYWGLCSLVDTHCGRILKTLEDCGLWDNTVIVFTSDHGEMMGSHQLLMKMLYYEEAMRVPMLIKAPGQRRCLRVDGPVSNVDLVPTVMDLMGARPAGHLQGRSRKALTEGRWMDLEDVFVESTTLSERRLFARRSIVTQDGWKYVWDIQGKDTLYNLKQDPFEVHNLAGAQESGKQIAELRKRIEAWQKRTGDEVKMG